jgi:hypothetical protein
MYCFKTTPLRLHDLWRAISLPTMTSLAAGAIVYALRAVAWRDWDRPIAAFTIETLTYGIVYLAAWACLPMGRELIGDAWRMFNRRSERQKIPTPLVATAAS